MSQEKRKYPRYDIELEVVFYNQQRSKGKLINVSKKGCLLRTDKGIMRSIGSMVTFRVFFFGKAQLHDNHSSKGIRMQDVESKIRNSKKNSPLESNDEYPDSVKIIAKVARHVEYKGAMAMGIELLELDGNDKLKWNSFLAKLAKDQFIQPYTGPQEVPQTVVVEPMTDFYSIRFKSLDQAIRYFPRDPSALLFLPAKVARKKGEQIKVSIIHPDNKTNLNFNAVIEGYGPFPKNEKIVGIYFRYQNFTPVLKTQINQFLNEEHFRSES